MSVRKRHCRLEALPPGEESPAAAPGTKHALGEPTVMIDLHLQTLEDCLFTPAPNADGVIGAVAEFERRFLTTSNPLGGDVERGIRELWQRSIGSPDQLPPPPADAVYDPALVRLALEQTRRAIDRLLRSAASEDDLSRFSLALQSPLHLFPADRAIRSFWDEAVAECDLLSALAELAGQLGPRTDLLPRHPPRLGPRAISTGWGLVEQALRFYELSPKELPHQLELQFRLRRAAAMMVAL